MRRTSLRLALVLMVLGLGLLGVATTTNWYAMDSDGDAFYSARGINVGQELQPERYVFHVPFWHAPHAGTLGGGTSFDVDERGHIEQVVGVTRIFFVLGLAGVAFASIGTMVRLRGQTGPNAGHATTGVVSVLALAFAIGFFAQGIPGATNDQLQERYGQGPEVALFTQGTTVGDGSLWDDVRSAPAMGVYLAIAGAAAWAASFVVLYMDALRRMGHQIVSEGETA